MPPANRVLATALPVAAGLLAAALLLALLGAAAARAVAAPLASPSVRYVTITGTDAAHDCSSSVAPCQTVQWALDQAQAGDQIRVAAGVYTSAGGAVANITQTVMLQVLTEGWPTHDPVQQGRMTFSLRRYDASGRLNEDLGEWKIDVIEAE